jgi:hypothetical protein
MDLTSGGGGNGGRGDSDLLGRPYRVREILKNKISGSARCISRDFERSQKAELLFFQQKPNYYFFGNGRYGLTGFGGLLMPILLVTLVSCGNFSRFFLFSSILFLRGSVEAPERGNFPESSRIMESSQKVPKLIGFCWVWGRDIDASIA